MSTVSVYEHFEENKLPQFLNENNVHYLLHVLRKKTNDPLTIVNGKGISLDAQIIQISKKECEIKVIQLNHEIPKNPQLQIAVAFTKNSTRMEWFLEKATEIGISAIIPLVTHRSEKLNFKKERFEKILIAAMLQSQQSYLPILHEATPIEKVAQQNGAQKYIAYCGEEYEKKSFMSLFDSQQDCIFLIGPEGDFTKEEVSLCLENNFKIIHLGNTRLRTETAALYVCTLFNALS
ncbi:MAG: 16S rRNA (uracil(1498)-N(3))-methyltransferase [Chitinophagaceae bacterium]|nr:MAG: 16S rRNA methyltransferase [Bacteroidetes bacterium OLB11]MCC6448758.1 16S rRNA (uracil(1498)-N(3))-methyltransferase [Chitinophagaceae bacterium]